MTTSMDLPLPTFDLESWARNYEGGILPLRLAHIAVHCPSLAHQSLALAIRLARSGKDVNQYARLTNLAGRLDIPDLAAPDQSWVSRTEEANTRELQRLEQELRGYKNNLIRESIRMGQDELAAHLIVTGGPAPDPTSPQKQNDTGYGAALMALHKLRDYCTTPTHVASMIVRQLYTSLLLAVSTQESGSSAATHFNAALTFANRLRTVGVREEEQAKLEPIIPAMMGVAHLALGNYAEAASAFLATPYEYAQHGAVHGIDFPKSFATGNDIAIYGGLCALATLSRDELNDVVLGGAFRPFLELEPHMRRAISLYVSAKYQACHAILLHYYADWNLDIFLGGPVAGMPTRASHVDVLLARVRAKSIKSYFSSYSQVSLANLASVFPPASSAPEAMEQELLTMIDAGQLDARLDVVNGLVIAPPRETRVAAHTNAQAAAAEIERTLLLRLHKVNVTLAGLEVPRPPKAGGGWGMGSGGGGIGGSGDGMKIGNGMGGY